MEAILSNVHHEFKVVAIEIFGSVSVFRILLLGAGTLAAHRFAWSCMKTAVDIASNVMPSPTRLGMELMNMSMAAISTPVMRVMGR